MLNCRFLPKCFAYLLILQNEADDSEGQEGSEGADLRRKKVEMLKVQARSDAGFLREN